MSNLISGKEALIALANGEEVEVGSVGSPHLGWRVITNYEDVRLKTFETGVNKHGYSVKFRIKPKTITLNGIEVPAPFDPKEGDKYFHLWPTCDGGYGHDVYESIEDDGFYIQFGAWRTEEEIKQVVEALRKVFNP